MGDMVGGVEREGLRVSEVKSPCSAPAEELPSCVSSSSIFWMSFSWIPFG